VERANQDAKSELGWDELEAQKYLAWMHHLALTILSLRFITQTKIEWAEQYARDPSLLQQFEWMCHRRCPPPMYELYCVPSCRCHS